MTLLFAARVVQVHWHVVAHVLIVDDDPDILDAFATALASHGYDVATAENGADALRALRQGLTPCAILLDLMMPVMDGWEFRRAQKRLPVAADIPVVVVSANAQVASLAREVDAVAWLEKPVELRDLLRTIERICDV